jgi:predicted O-methyltransferase YrrM
MPALAEEVGLSASQKIMAAVRETKAASVRFQLAMSGQTKLSRALDRRDFGLRDEIERHRRRMLADTSPLAAAKEESGPYDEGQSVADACRVSKAKRAARYLYSITAEYRPKVVLELGTNVGISSSYLAAAGSAVTTCEASPARIEVAKRLHKALGLSNITYVRGLFADTLEDTLSSLPPVDLAFIDGHHQYQPTLDYFAAIRAHASSQCVFIFDDIGWSEGMERAWTKLKPQFDTTAEAGGMGIGLQAK